MNILECTNQLINEGYVFSDKTISIDLDKFESGSMNKLFIVGLSGSGKTTLGIHLGKVYNAEYVDTDDIVGESDQTRVAVLKKIIDNPSKKYIIGGALIIKSYYRDYISSDILMTTPVLLLGKSTLKSTIDAFARNIKDKRKNRGNIDRSVLRKLKVNIKKLQPMINKFKEDRIKAGGDVQEFKVPRL